IAGCELPLLRAVGVERVDVAVTRAVDGAVSADRRAIVVTDPGTSNAGCDPFLRAVVCAGVELAQSGVPEIMLEHRPSRCGQLRVRYGQSGDDQHGGRRAA